MADLRRIFTDAGCSSVNTYIQSGNVVFSADIKSAERFAGRIGAAIEAEFGFRPGIQLLTGKELEQAIANNPYSDAVEDPKSLHVAFLDQMPGNANVQRVKKLLAPSESCKLIGHNLYLHAPDGIARSKFVARMEKTLGVGVTARNWRSTTRIAALTAEVTD